MSDNSLMMKGVPSDRKKKFFGEYRKAIGEFRTNGYCLVVFPGSLSANDFIVQYVKRESSGRLRTPKHVHWAVDLLMKLQGNRELTISLIQAIRAQWDLELSLSSNSLEDIEKAVNTTNGAFDLSGYEELNQYGEYEVDFLFILMKLLMIQERTNRPDAFMFGGILDKLIAEPLDIFSIISSAGFRGSI